MSAKTKTISAPVDLATLAEAARRGPITVTAGGKAAFVAVSPEEFERLARRATGYEGARDRVMAAVRAMQRTAAARGLTEEELERCLPMRADRVVLDTNVLISAALSSLGKPFASLAWVRRNATLVSPRHGGTRRLASSIPHGMVRPPARPDVRSHHNCVATNDCGRDRHTPPDPHSQSRQREAEGAGGPGLQAAFARSHVQTGNPSALRAGARRRLRPENENHTAREECSDRQDSRPQDAGACRRIAP